jgi:adenylosuccinate lyase
MINRYNTPIMSEIWSDAYKINLWKQISSQYAYQLAEQNIDLNDLLSIEITAQEIIEKEKITKHEFLAFLELFIDKAPPNTKKYIHYGLTSSDILDTGFSLQLIEASKNILGQTQVLVNTLKEKAEVNRLTLMMGRTHGMYAEPISFGRILMSFAYEFERSIQRLNNALNHISYGQLSGPVGNYTVCFPKVEKLTLGYFGLKPELISTQVIPRDRYAELFCTLGILASSMERLATEIRQLSQSSVGEVAEGFAANQKGSSAMPHKKNPIGSENICGLARLIRSYMFPALENIVLWHERDMSHSSNERLISQDATSLTYYCLTRLNQIVQNLQVNANQMLTNIQNANGVYYSQHLLISLINKGVDRAVAYGMVQAVTFEVQKTGESFVNLLLKDNNIKSILSEDEIIKLVSGAPFYLQHTIE